MAGNVFGQCPLNRKRGCHSQARVPLTLDWPGRSSGFPARQLTCDKTDTFKLSPYLCTSCASYAHADDALFTSRSYFHLNLCVARVPFSWCRNALSPLTETLNATLLQDRIQLTAIMAPCLLIQSFLIQQTNRSSIHLKYLFSLLMPSNVISNARKNRGTTTNV